MRTRAGAVGEKISIDMTASVRIYESIAMGSVLIVARSRGIGSWNLAAGAGNDVVVLIQLEFGARCGGLRPAMDSSTVGTGKWLLSLWR